MSVCSQTGMRRTLLAAASLAATAALGWVAAPALSLAPEQPQASDFEQRLPAVRQLAAPTRFRSPVVEAPHEFDLVGLAGETREVEVRVRHGDAWTGWVETDNGDPVYAGGAEAVQLRASGFEPVGELHYVNLTEPQRGVLGSMRGAIHSALLTLASSPPARLVAPKLAEAAVARRAPPMPAVVSRAAWGADNPGTGCPPRAGPVYGQVHAAVVHHTVSAVGYAPEEAPGIVLGICRYHVFGNGWNDIGYNALVDSYGTTYEGRAGGLNLPVVGAHAEGYNSQTTGIASIGDHTATPPTPQAINSIVNFLAWKMFASAAVPVRGTAALLSAGGATNRFPSGTTVTLPRIFGHGTTNNTECPGATMAPLVASIQARVQARIKKYTRIKRKRLKKKHRHGKRGKKKPRRQQPPR
ncbi:MAG: N-acetylmuramoyl-L-alanine amidase [Solirubrobacterales bacterium]